MKKRATIVLLAALLLSSCGMRHARAVMDDVETYLQEAPDSARVALQALPLRTHYFPWQHARYCLLLSSALDRSGVLVENDSLARYAADFYDHFGSPVKRFYSQYYLGRVHENRGDRQSAMEAYIKAENITSNKVPNRFRCALEMHMGAIYAQIFEFDRAVEKNEQAAAYAKQDGLWSAYAESLLRIAKIYTTYGRLEKADKCRRELDSLLNEEPEWLRLSISGLDSRRMLIDGLSRETIARFNDSVILAHKQAPHLIPWEDFSITYVRSGNVDKALSAIQEYGCNHEAREKSIYYGILSEVLDSLGDLRGSLDAYKQYLAITDSLDLTIFNQDTKFLKERYSLQTQASRRKRQVWFSITVALLIIGSLLFVMIRRRKENTRLKNLYADLQEEYQYLKKLPSRLEGLSKEATELLGNRMAALSSFFTKKRPESLSLIAPQLESLTNNRKVLVETIGLLYAVYRPDFMMKLVERGLTPAECGYCCLIALGLRNGEVSDVINREGVNNINSAIRKKLGIQANSTKLGTVLKEMFGDSGS